jgi:hypothetical protein
LIRNNANKRTRRCLEKKNVDCFFGFCLRTFSPFDVVKMVLGPEIFAAGKRSRFNRIGFVSFVGVEGLVDINKRLVIDGAEQGNEISIKVFAK